MVVGQNSVTSEGLKSLYALMLAAVIGRNTVQINFDDSNNGCYINRALILP